MPDRETPSAGSAWSALFVLNGALALGAAIVAIPFVVLARAGLAEQGWTRIDPTLIDDGLTGWVMAAVVAGFLLAAVVVPANLLLARRIGLQGRTWKVVALVVLVGGGLLLNRWMTPSRW